MARLVRGRGRAAQLVATCLRRHHQHPPDPRGTSVPIGQHQHFWAALCHKVGLPELASNERYDTARASAPCRTGSALAARTAPRNGGPVRRGFAPRPALLRIVRPPVALAEGLIERFEHPTLAGYRGFCGPLISQPHRWFALRGAHAGTAHGGIERVRRVASKHVTSASGRPAASRCLRRAPACVSDPRLQPRHRTP